jgi:hypothetical protein
VPEGIAEQIAPDWDEEVGYRRQELPSLADAEALLPAEAAPG